jgi:hypothetical protein
LFWSLLAVAFLLDGVLAFLGVQLLGLAGHEATPSAERRMYVPYAANAALWEPMRRWAIRVDGKPQLFESMAREAVRRVTGEEHFEDNDALPVAVSWMMHGFAWEEYPFLRGEDAELRSLVYRDGWSTSQMPRDEQLLGRYVEPAVLRQSKGFRKILRGMAAQGGAGEEIPLSAVERRAVELNGRLALFDCLRTGGVDTGDGADMKTATEALREAYLSGSADVFAVAVADFLDASRQSLRWEENPTTRQRLAVEGWINQYRPLRQAMYWSILAAGLLAVSTMAGVRRPIWRRGCLLSGLLACAGCLGWSGATIVCQAILHDGIPVRDGMEAVLWGSSAALALSLLLTMGYRDGFIALTGALVAGGGFVLANRWPSRFVENWATLPILPSDEVWSCLQRPAVISAYGGLALAWGVSALTLGRLVLIPPTCERLRGLARLCARSIGVAVVLFAVSALLDGLRARHPSGSGLGWNMQAISTFLVLPSCVAVLYGRRMGWITPFGTMMLTVAGAAALALAWQSLPHLDGNSPAFASILTENAPVYLAGLASLCLAAHAALRYYFGKQRILDA